MVWSKLWTGESGMQTGSLKLTLYILEFALPDTAI